MNTRYCKCNKNKT